MREVRDGRERAERGDIRGGGRGEMRYELSCYSIMIHEQIKIHKIKINNIISSLFVNENIMIYLQFPNPTNINV